uniref:AlNc14C86G5510 protein n=1 Tax=Albugo laibachii Nc14 TaxID=890382 RepID=F0WFX6_9STRA|nr:AlNc14C86G5510 [Albugo laibachii Nc14]|eukprot:CCA20110.1 AlNc14C86G5510 [Albugo laibachii Nc14]
MSTHSRYTTLIIAHLYICIDPMINLLITTVLLASSLSKGSDVIIKLRKVQSFDRLIMSFDTQYVGDFLIDDTSRTLTIATPSTIHFCILYSSVDYDHGILFAGNAGLCIIASYPKGPHGIAVQEKVSHGTLHLGHFRESRKGVVFTSQKTTCRDLYVNITSHRDAGMMYLPVEVGSQGEWMLHMDGYSVGPEIHVVRSYKAIFKVSTRWITGPMKAVKHIASMIGAEQIDESGYFRVKCSASLPAVAFRLGERSMQFHDIDYGHHTILRTGNNCVLPIRFKIVWDLNLWELGTAFMHGRNTSFWPLSDEGKYEIGLTRNFHESMKEE